MNTQRWTLQSLSSLCSLTPLCSLPRHAHLLASAAVMALCLLFSSDAHAQDSMPSPEAEKIAEGVKAWESTLPITSPAWNDNFGAQAAALLASGNETVRNTMLQNVVHLAHNNAAYRLDLSETMPALLDIYTRDRTEERRIMAAVAIHAIAQHNEAFDPTVDMLRKRLHDQPSKRVRKHTLNVLVDYYGKRGEQLALSPELYREYKQLKRSR